MHWDLRRTLTAVETAPGNFVSKNCIKYFWKHFT